MKGNLYLIPTVIAPETADSVIPPQVIEVINQVDYYLVENIRTARRFISELHHTLEAASLPKPIDEIQFVQLSKDTTASEVTKQLRPLHEGKSAGIISEAGCPGIADPGSIAVSLAHEQGIKVIPLVGPSSILLALMASGFSGQSFVFHGYLPIQANERGRMLKHLEKEAQRNSQTQIFMETPYRNEKLFKDILLTCSRNTRLCVAKDVTGPKEFIATKTIGEWESIKIDLHKIPTMFLIYAS